MTHQTQVQWTKVSSSDAHKPHPQQTDVTCKAKWQNILENFIRAHRFLYQSYLWLPCDCLHPAYCSLPPAKQERLCEDAVCGLQLRIQYHSACHTGCEAPDSRTKQISVQLDPGLSDRQKSGGQNGQQHFISADPQHWCSAGLRSQPTPVLPVHTWLCSHTQLQRHRQIRWRHNGDSRGGSREGPGGGQCPPVNKLGPPLAPPKFGIISQQTIWGEMHSLFCKLYIYIKKNITSC